MELYEKHDCWSLLLRIWHWVFAPSIVALVITGFYIHFPWTNTSIEGSQSWPMAWARHIHFVAGYAFSCTIIIRAYLYIFGRPQERVWDILPINSRNLGNLKRTIMRYTYLSDGHHERIGHNVLAGMSYLFTFFVAIVMALTGFYLLFPEVSFIASAGDTLFHTQQTARFVHHLCMWWFMIFVVIHLYLCIWNDLRFPEGLISSIFTGQKFTRKH